MMSSANSRKITVQTIQIRDAEIKSTSAARNIGVVFDDIMDIGKQIVKVCQTFCFWLRNIRQIMHCLTFDAALVQSLVLSRFDSCNAIYYGLPKYQIAKL